LLLRRSKSNKPKFFFHLNKCDEILDDRFAAGYISANISCRTTGVREEVLEAGNLISIIHQFVYLLSKNILYAISNTYIGTPHKHLYGKALKQSKHNMV